MKFRSAATIIAMSAAMAASAGDSLVTTKDDVCLKDGVKCLLVGDSIMAYGGTYGYAPLTKKFLKEQLGVSLGCWECNGAGGRSTTHLTNVTSNCYIPTLLKSKSYDYVFIQIGINDRNNNVSWSDYKSNLEWIFQQIEAAGAKPVLLGICQYDKSPSGWALLQREYCANRATPVLFCDCSKYMTAAISADGIKQSSDGIHPNYYGYRWMAWAMLKAIGVKDDDKEAVIGFFDEFYKSVMYFSVDFLDWDRTPLAESQLIFRECCATAPAEPTRAGYTFVGWSPNAGTNVYSSAEVNEIKVYEGIAYTAWYTNGESERDVAGTTYTWKGGSSGDWRTKANWTMTAAGVLGYPDHETYAACVIPSAADIDLGGTTNGVASLSLPDTGTVAFRNGCVRSASSKNLLETSKHLLLDNCTLYCIDQSSDLFCGTKSGVTIDLMNGAYFNGKGYMWNYSSSAEAHQINSLGGDNFIRDLWLRAGDCTITIKNGSLATTGGYHFYAESGTYTINTDDGTLKPSGVSMKSPTVVFNAKLGASPKPVLDATGLTASFTSATVTFKVDASAVKTSGTYVIAVAKSLKFGSGKLTLKVTGTASGCSATLQQNGNQIELVVTCGDTPTPTPTTAGIYNWNASSGKLAESANWTEAQD